ncbi:MAG TPA: helix-turn-helix domain-containing protein [Candidatus Limnocylindrales bacterium]
MADASDYCAFTKAVEHFGDRWSLVIVRELLLRGTLGFNGIGEGLPGISRSVLAARLHKLEDLGVIERAEPVGNSVPGYRLTHSGRALRPVLSGLRIWSERFVPQDPAMVERDPDIVPMWLTQRLDASAFPARPVVIDLTVAGSGAERFWLVLEGGLEPSACIEDPCLDGGRYVFLESDVPGLYPVARGERSMRAAVEDGAVRLFGEPDLVRALPNWFRAPASGATGMASTGAMVGATQASSEAVTA